MKIESFKCELCSAKAANEKQLRKENWLRIRGGSLAGVSVWLDTPRNAGGSMMLTVGWQDKEYDFCSIDCLVKALKGTESI
jgi:hypothetical protein